MTEAHRMGGRPDVRVLVSRVKVVTEAICESALTAIDSEGPDALTARLAGGVEIPNRTPYERVKGRDGSIRNVAALRKARPHLSLHQTCLWTVTYTEWCRRLYRQMLEYRHTTALLIRHDRSRLHSLTTRPAFDAAVVADRSTSREGVGFGSSQMAVVTSALSAQQSRCARQERSAPTHGVDMYVNRVEQRSLAWNMVDVAGPYLTEDERIWFCVKIGVGELESVLLALVGRCMRNDVELPADVYATLRCWLNGYAGTEVALAFQPYVEPMPLGDPVSDRDTQTSSSPTKCDRFRNRPRRFQSDRFNDRVGLEQLRLAAQQ